MPLSLSNRYYMADILNTTSLTPVSNPLLADFRNTLWLIWRHLNLPEPTPIQYDIARWMQHGPQRLIIEAFRGVGKSFIAAAFVIWSLLNNPQLKIMVVSASKQRADAFSTFVLRLIEEVPQFRHLWPRDNQRSSMEMFDVGPATPDQSPSVKSVGITGQLTGSRADIIIADDIEVPQNSATQGMRDKLLDLIREFDAVIKPLPHVKIMYLGTPQTEQSIYNKLPERGYVIRVWPARYPTPEQEGRYGARLAPFISSALRGHPGLAGTPTEPLRFDEEDLQKRLMSWGRSGFALQYMLDTSLSDADKYPLKLKDFIVHPLDTRRAPIDFMWASGPDHIYPGVEAVGLQGDNFHRPGWVAEDTGPYEGCCLFIDPSGMGADETGYAVVKVMHGRMFLVASGGTKDGYSEQTLKKLVDIAKRHSVNIILHETNYGGGMFGSLMQGACKTYGYPCKVEEADWSNTQKELRIIDTLEPVLMQHRLVVDPQVIVDDYNSTVDYLGEEVNRCRLFYQLARITRDRGSLARDDRLDALAGAVAYWSKQLARVTDVEIVKFKEREIQKELDDFMQHLLDKPRKQVYRGPRR